MAEEEKKATKAKQIVFPRRKPSVAIPNKEIQYPTADIATCPKCVCFPKEDPYIKTKKINPCQKSPLSLFDLAGKIVNELRFPEAFDWTVEHVADWMEYVVGFPQYRSCILDNRINGRRLLLLEDPSHHPEINIHYWLDIKVITKKIYEVFSSEFILFARSVGLPPRKPLTACTRFKSRTGPSWGIRQNWERLDILRQMYIVGSKPLMLDHWDLVWYRKPLCPKTLLARIPMRESGEEVPHYKFTRPLPCKEYQMPRKFILQRNILPEHQVIWNEYKPGSPHPRESELARERQRKAEEKVFKPTIPKPTRLDPRKFDITKLRGNDFILARRLMPRKKFFVN